MVNGDPDNRIGLMHTWWRGDPLPALPPLPSLTMARIDDLPLLTDLTSNDEQEIRRRIAHGHQSWLARLDGVPVASGWVAANQATIPHLGLTLTFRPDDRYLWDFTTLPPWRGRGIYPRLLQAIIRSDESANRFWVGHDTPNVASRHGIANAGFQHCGTLYDDANHGHLLVPAGPIERATAAAAFLGVKLAQPDDV